ncbi:MAG: hypothetical protein Q9207_003163 [Kuettlingeria erythrocarpa]
METNRQASCDSNGGTAPLISTSPTPCVPFSKATSGEPSVKLGPKPQSRTSSAVFTDTPKTSQFQYSPLRTVSRKEGEPTDGLSNSTTKLPPSTQDLQSQVLDARSYMAKIFSPTNNEGTPRGSTDLYSTSDDTSDTLESDIMHAGNGSTSYQSNSRQERSQHLQTESRQAPEVLMMGFGNVVGNFSLDPSLVDPSPFDEVRNKAVVGNQGGGGVVRAGSTKSQNGLLGFFGWNALGASLGDLLAGNEISSIKEATKSENAKWFPILSTPQSLLFTNLRLEPGESQSYTFSYRLPPGLPPTYKGKALKVSYNIIIGIQRATQPAQQHIVRSVDFPFRVLPNINGHGDTMSHDLKSPCVMLHNEPLIWPLKDFKRGAVAASKPSSHPQIDNPEQDFSSYLNQLLDKPGQEYSGGVLPPSAIETRAVESAAEEPAPVENAIALAIQKKGKRELDSTGHGLLEDVAEDERGSVSAALQAMSCETFDVQLPLRLYGDKRSLDDSSSMQERAI